MRSFLLRHSFAAALTLSLAACGGGGSSSSAPGATAVVTGGTFVVGHDQEPTCLNVYNQCGNLFVTSYVVNNVLAGSFRITPEYTYEPVEGWGRLPEGWSLREVGAVAVDSQDRVYVFNRGEHPMVVFDREGNFLTSWGEGLFSRADWLRLLERAGFQAAVHTFTPEESPNTAGDLFVGVKPAG